MIQVIRGFFFLFISSLLCPVFAASSYSHYSITATYNRSELSLDVVQKVRFTNSFSREVQDLYFVVDNSQVEPNPYLDSSVNDIGYSYGYESAPIVIHEISSDRGVIPFTFLDETKFLPLKKYSHKRSLFKIQLPVPLGSGQETVFQIRFTVHIPQVYLPLHERFHHKELSVLRFGWYPIEVSRENDEWQLKKFQLMPHFIDSLVLKVPETLDVVAAGDRVEEYVIDGYKSVEIHHSHSVVSSPIAIGTGLQVLSARSSDNVEVRVYYLNATYRERAQRILDNALQIIPYYNQKFGRFKYSRICILQAPMDRLWGVAADGFFMMGSLAFSTSDLVAPRFMDRWIHFVTAHELAHLWAGVGTTVDFNRDNALSEGLSQYMTYDYLNAQFGVNGDMFSPESGVMGEFIVTLRYFLFGEPVSYTSRQVHTYTYETMHQDGWDESLLLALKDANLHRKQAKDYSKGYMVFKTWETNVGKRAFQLGLRDYFQTSKPFGTIEGMAQSMEKYTTENQTEFVQSWFHEAQFLDLSVGSITASDSNYPVISQIQINKMGTAPTIVPIRLTFEAGETRMIQLASFSSPTKTISVQGASPVQIVEIDPFHTILETDRHNNRFPIVKTDIPLVGGASLFKYKPVDETLVSVGPTLFTRLSFGLGPKPGFGVRLKELKLGEYQSQFGVVTHVNSNEESSVAGFGELSLNMARNQWFSLSGLVDINGEAEAAAVIQHPIYRSMDLGQFGMFEYPETMISYGVRHRYFSPEVVTMSGLLSWEYISITRPLRVSSMFEVADSFTKWDNFGMLGFRVWPRVILAPSVRISRAMDMPPELDYSTRLMRGVSEETSPGNEVTIGSLNLLFPIYYGVQSVWLDMVVFRGLSGSVFVETGATENDDQRTTAGMEISLRFSTMWDMVFPMTIGFAKTIDDRGPEDSEIYFDFSFSSINIFNVLYGY